LLLYLLLTCCGTCWLLTHLLIVQLFTPWIGRRFQCRPCVGNFHQPTKQKLRLHRASGSARHAWSSQALGVLEGDRWWERPKEMGDVLIQLAAAPAAGRYLSLSPWMIHPSIRDAGMGDKSLIRSL